MPIQLQYSVARNYSLPSTLLGCMHLCQLESPRPARQIVYSNGTESVRRGGRFLT